MWSTLSVRAGILCLILTSGWTSAALGSEIDPQTNAQAGPTSDAQAEEPLLPFAKKLDWEKTGLQPSSYHLKLAWKLSLCLLILFGAFIAFLVWKRRSGWTPIQSSCQMRVVETMTVGPGVTLRLLDVGSQRVLVGHDRHGLKRMVVLHREFDELMDSPGLVEPPGGSVDAATPPMMPQRQSTDRRRMPSSTFSTPKDHGWALNHSTT